MFIKYDFKNSKKGNADGVISIMPDIGSVRLCWGEKVGEDYVSLEEYLPLWNKDMPEQGIVIDKGLVIPPKATVLIAETQSDRFVYEIPPEKIPDYPKKPVATFAFASDLHFGGWGSKTEPKRGIALAGEDINKFADALIIAGDTVQWHGSYSEEEFMKYNHDGVKYGDNGETSTEYLKIGVSQWEVLNDFLKTLNVPVLITSGGHDIRDNEMWSTMCSNDEYWRDFLKKWIAYSAETGKYTVERDECVGYYDVNLFGYDFVLTTIPESCTPVISQKQLEWLENKLTEKEKNGKPVFVIGHEPCLEKLNIGGRETIKNIDEFRQVLNGHPSCIYVSGHSHYTLDTLLVNAISGNGKKPSCFHDGGMTTICSMEYKGQAEGTQCVFLELYDNFAITKARNCLEGKWIPLGFTEIKFK